MIFELIDKLLDRIIQLINHKKRMDQDLYNNFISPICGEFEAIHNEYLTTFSRYRQLLKDESVSIENILDLIREDRLFNEGQRLKILSHCRNLPCYKGETDLIEAFLFRIGAYLETTQEFVPVPLDADLAPGQYWRGSLLRIIELIEESDEIVNLLLKKHNMNKRKAEIEALDSLVSIMQRIYADIRKDCSKLQQTLLMV